MGRCTLEQLCQWVANAGPRVENVGGQLMQARAEIQKLGEVLGDLQSKKQQVESAIASIQSQIAQLASQASYSDDDDEDGSAAALQSQISALQGRLGQYEGLLSEINSGIEQTRSQIAAKQQEASVSTSKLTEMDKALETIDQEFGDHLREGIQAKDVLSRAGAVRFASASASNQISVIQGRINTCMSNQSKIRTIRDRIQQFLGDERDEREKKLTLGRSR